MKLILGVSLLALTSCAGFDLSRVDLTPLQKMADDNNRRNQEIANQYGSKTCTVVDLGGGRYTETCH